jgi:hypothetical protein
MTLWLKIVLALAVLALTTVLSLALGAQNLGTALGIGQIAFTVVVIWLLLRR